VSDTLRTPAPATTDWKLSGLCAQTDPEAFFPDEGGSVRAANRICSQCPVQAECLSFALTNNERFGIWGGVTESGVEPRYGEKPPLSMDHSRVHPHRPTTTD